MTGGSAVAAHRIRVIEALAYTVVVRVAIPWLPFRYLVRAFTRPVRRPGGASAVRAQTVVNVRRAVRSAVARLPGCTSCLARAAAAQAMLRRRGVSTTLYYGATTTVDRCLHAHVWLCAGDIGVVGQEEAARYMVVMTYSSFASPPGVVSEDS